MAVRDTEMKVAKLAVSSESLVKDVSHERTNRSVLRLRALLNDLINEVELLEERSVSFSETWVLKDRMSVNFYDEVERFESALIRGALRRTNGHQLNAARLLNLNPSTLNAKIKQYRIQHVFYRKQTLT